MWGHLIACVCAHDANPDLLPTEREHVEHREEYQFLFNRGMINSELSICRNQEPHGPDEKKVERMTPAPAPDSVSIPKPSCISCP